METFLHESTDEIDQNTQSESLIERAVINQYKKGINNLSQIARNINESFGVDIAHQKVGRILEDKGLRTI